MYIFLFCLVFYLLLLLLFFVESYCMQTLHNQLKRLEEGSWRQQQKKKKTMPKRPRSVLHEYVLPPGGKDRRPYNTSKSLIAHGSTRSKLAVTEGTAETTEGVSLRNYTDARGEREVEEDSAAITDRHSPFTQPAAYATEGQDRSFLQFPSFREPCGPGVCGGAASEEKMESADDVEPIFSLEERMDRLPPSCREAYREPNWLERAVLLAKRRDCAGYMVRGGIVMTLPEPAQLCISQCRGESSEVVERRAALMKIVAAFYTS